HFQLQNRYFEDTIRFAASALFFEPWGLIGCQLDTDSLANGTVNLIHARGVFPDGLPFNMPESDPLPSPRNIADLFPPNRDTLAVLLSIPQHKPDGLNCAAEDSGDGLAVRYFAEERLLHDETTGRDEKPVQLARKNIRLLLETEPSSDLLTLPIARVTRDGSGQFVFDPAFIPPCVRIDASERLMILLQRLIEILDEKSSMFSLAGKGDKRSWAEFSTREIANFWLLHTVNSALAPLRHLYLSRRGHPEDLYLELLRLGGALCTFALDSHPRELPLYNHQRLDECFAALDDHIRRRLETIVPTQYIQIPLTKRADYFYEGAVTDQRCLDTSRWIFAVRSPAGEVDIIAKTPQIVKLCSKQFVPQLVKRALPGLPLTHLPVPPSAIPARVDFQYF
ncbi:MAG: type VI secretion system baseplate subunit TssK, partial [Pseudomonadota bacterium]